MLHVAVLLGRRLPRSHTSWHEKHRLVRLSKQSRESLSYGLLG